MSKNQNYSNEKLYVFVILNRCYIFVLNLLAYHQLAYGGTKQWILLAQSAINHMGMTCYWKQMYIIKSCQPFDNNCEMMLHMYKLSFYLFYSRNSIMYTLFNLCRPIRFFVRRCQVTGGNRMTVISLVHLI